jgi:serine/threonine protein phosphatase PrpC
MKAFIHQITLKGKRESNQDRICIKQSNNELIIGVYDGHGVYGDFVSSHLKKHFINGANNLNDKKELQEYIYNYQYNLGKYKQSKESGSTLLMMKINLKNRKTLTVNLGDCRAIIGYNEKVLQLTNDHKVDDENERVPLMINNANVEYDYEDEMFRVDGYAVSRAMGNKLYKSISQKADIYSHEFSKNSKYIVLACDGLWDSMTNSDVNKLILNNLESVKLNSHQTQSGKNNMAYLLAKQAIKSGSQDNVSVVVVLLS